jgi:hypothetical protein
MMRAAWLILVLAVAACGEPSPDRGLLQAQAAGDASTEGCTASARFDVCEQHPDGSESCHDACTSSEYALSCTSAEPEESLRCAILPVPTPLGVSVYCCPSLP